MLSVVWMWEATELGLRSGIGVVMCLAAGAGLLDFDEVWEFVGDSTEDGPSEYAFSTSRPCMS
jgi:hypothetical protein